MPLILSGNVASATADAGYTVANSCRFNSADSAELHKTPGSAGNLDAWTLSFWFKRSNISGAGATSYQALYGVYADANNQEILGIQDDDKIYWQLYQSGSVVGQLTTNRVFRDVSAWYNIVISYDSANGTAGNRMRMWINGTEETSFSTDTNPSSGQDSQWNGTTKHQIGMITTTNKFDGYLAEVVSLDGTAVTDATNFGEFDEDSPTIWKPIDVSGLTFGTNGFYLDFEDSSNLGNDVNGGTDLTEVNLAAADQMTDTPTNNYSTWNPLSIATSGTPTFSEGNLQVITPVSGAGWSISTIGATSGKWYLEIYVVAYASLDRTAIGITGDVFGSLAGNTNIGLLTNSLDVGYWQNGYSAVGNSTDTDYGDTFAVGDLMGIALNIDDNEVIFYKNNTAQNSGTAVSFTAGSTYHFCLNDGSGGGGNTTVANFGQDGTFAGNKTAGGNADGAGYGNFFYSPPSGFYALCTKNLAEFG